MARRCDPRPRSADGEFSLETVECLGACDMAPVVQVNLGPYHGPMTAESLSSLIDELVSREKGNGRG